MGFRHACLNSEAFTIATREQLHTVDIYIYKHTFESDDSVGCRNYVAGLQQGYSKWEVVF